MLLGNAPFYLTGYGTQLKMIGDKLIQQGFPVAHAADFGYAGSKIEWEGRTLYPHDKLPGTLNAETLRSHIESFQRAHALDKVILWSLGDTWKFSRINSVVKHPDWVCMTPVDADRLDSPTMASLSSSSHPVSISQYGKNIMQSVGLDASYLPHMIDPVFGEPIDKEFARASAGIPSEAFVVGYFGDLSMRKSPYETIEAFAKFASRVNNAVFLIKGSNHINGLSMQKLISDYNLTGRVIAIPNYDSLIGFTEKEMARAYACMDVLVHASAQEGFGIMQAEAQACGVPVINTDFGCMKELQSLPELAIAPLGLHRTQAGTFIPQVPADGIVERLLKVYSMSSEEREKMSETAHRWAKRWYIDKVWAEHYEPFIEQLCFEDFTRKRLNHAPRPIKKVGFVATFDTTCGIATYTLMLAKELQKKGIEVVVFSEIEDMEMSKPGEPLVHEGVNHYRCWDRSSRVVKPFLDCLISENVDMLHFQHEWQLFKHTALIEAVREMPMKKVCTYHTPTPESLGSLMAVTDVVLDAHITHWPETSQLLPMCTRHGMLGGLQTIKHGVLEHDAPSVENPKMDWFGIPKKVPMFFTFGFASGSKGLDYFVDAAIKASETPGCPYFEVVISMSPHPAWSSDEYRAMVHEKASACDFITVVDGFMSEEEIDRHASACDYLVFSYRWPQTVYSASGAVRRALGHGKPVLVSDEGRLRDLAGGIHGWKFGQYDIDSFAKSIVDAVHSFGTEKYQTFEANVKELCQKDSWTNTAKQHIDLYAKIGSTWSVIPEPMIRARKVESEKPYPELIDAVLESSAGPEPMRDNSLSVEEEIHSQMKISEMLLEEFPDLLEKGGEE
tara:strand:+ start:247 stop:2775 length:2529 start_codon:yes stop_codon:yes gene_type:complete